MAETTTSSDEKAQARPRYDDINTPVVVMWGFISAVLTLVTILTVSGVYNVWSASWERAREGQVVNRPARQQVDEQKQVLAGEQGSIAIGDAMKKVIDQYGK